MPKVGDQVIVYEIECVTWPDHDNGVGVSGVVTKVFEDTDPAWRYFYFMPDSPDPTVNDTGSKADDYRPSEGWQVYNQQKWKRKQFIIQELDLT